jgi:hypothetical protein
LWQQLGYWLIRLQAFPLLGQKTAEPGLSCSV